MNAKIVYEYFYDESGNISGWQQWNATTFPEKAIFQNNPAPLKEMNRPGILKKEKYRIENGEIKKEGGQIIAAKQITG